MNYVFLRSSSILEGEEFTGVDPAAPPEVPNFIIGDDSLMPNMFPWNAEAEERKARTELTPEYEAEEAFRPAVPDLGTAKLEDRGISDTVDAFHVFEKEHALWTKHPNSVNLFPGPSHGDCAPVWSSLL